MLSLRYSVIVTENELLSSREGGEGTFPSSMFLKLKNFLLLLKWIGSDFNICIKLVRHPLFYSNVFLRNEYSKYPGRYAVHRAFANIHIQILIIRGQLKDTSCYHADHLGYFNSSTTSGAGMLSQVTSRVTSASYLCFLCFWVLARTTSPEMARGHRKSCVMLPRHFYIHGLILFVRPI